MRGKPKFKVNDNVSFEFKGETKTGVVWIVDAYGTFDDPSDASYDIYVESENMLYKHFSERFVKKVRKRKITQQS